MLFYNQQKKKSNSNVKRLLYAYGEYNGLSKIETLCNNILIKLGNLHFNI